MKKILIYIAILGLTISSCKKDEVRVVILSNPVVPTLSTLPNLTLQRTHGTDTLVFVGTPVNPGFRASATYFLEACKTGNNFRDSIPILSGVQDTLLKITVSDLNGVLLKKLPADQVSSVDFRIRSVLSIDAGTGYKPMIYTSQVSTANVTVYGLPRLDLLNSGITQKIESALGDGKYTGFVKLDATKPFTLKNPDSNTTYGVSGGGLGVNGTPIPVSASGWYKLSANINALTYTLDPYMVGFVGSATPNGWNSPDQKMDYNPQTGTWNITITVITGEFKFRLNDAWSVNWGGTPSNLVFNGSNLAITAGNYTIALTITNDTPGSNTGTCTIVKN